MAACIGAYRDTGCPAARSTELMSKEVDVTRSVGRRIDAYVHGGSKLPNLEQAWCDAAYWFHEGLAETLEFHCRCQA